MFAESLSGRRRRVVPAIIALLLGSGVSPWAMAQVKSLDIQPGTPMPTIEVINNGSDYSAISSTSVEFPVSFSAQCANRSSIDTYYLITNSSEPDFSNQEIQGTVGTGEIGYMRLVKPQGSSASLAQKEFAFKVPVNELFAGAEPVPLHICRELLKRRVKRGVNKTTILAQDWKIVQPLHISFMPSCVAKNRTYWSKQTTTQLVNYLCKASKAGIAAEARRVADEEKRKTADVQKKAEPPTQVAALPKARPSPPTKSAPVSKPKPKPVVVEKVVEKKTVEVAPEPVAKVSEPITNPVVPKPSGVAELSITVVPGEYKGECPALIAFKGKITSAKKGLVKFHFEDRGQAEATRAVMFRAADQTQRFQTQALVEESISGSAKLVLESPEAGQAETQYKVVCSN